MAHKRSRSSVLEAQRRDRWPRARLVRGERMKVFFNTSLSWGSRTRLCQNVNMEKSLWLLLCPAQQMIPLKRIQEDNFVLKDEWLKSFSFWGGRDFHWTWLKASMNTEDWLLMEFSWYGTLGQPALELHCPHWLVPVCWRGSLGRKQYRNQVSQTEKGNSVEATGIPGRVEPNLPEQQIQGSSGLLARGVWGPSL